MATQQFTLDAETRTEHGKRSSRRLRRLEGKVPAVIYGGHAAPQSLMLEHRKVIRALEDEGIYSHILTLNIDGKPQQVVLKDLHRHPFKSQILHMDFMRISATDKIHMHIPLHFKGEDVAPGVKEKGGMITHNLIEVEITCLPKDLPEFIEVDVSNLDIDDVIHLSQLKIPAGVQLVALAHDNDMPVVAVHMPRAEVVAEETTETSVTEEGESSSSAESDSNEQAG